MLGLGFLGFEELPEDERPPRAIWLEGDEMTKWWKAVDEMRREKYGSSGSRDGDIRDTPISGDTSRNAFSPRG